MQTRQTVEAIVLAGLWLASAAAGADTAFTVSLDTSSIAGTTEQLVFEFVDGDGVVDNSALLSGFSFGGGTIAGSADYLGSTGVSGDLNGSVSMDDSGGTALFTQLVTFGSSLSFELTPTNNFSGVGAPDAFSMAIYTADFSACYSDDQTACSLLQLDLNAAALSPASFTLKGASEQSLPAPVVTLAGTAPEPGSLTLLATGIVLAVRRRKTGRS